MVLAFMEASALARVLRLRETCDALTAAMSALTLKGRVMAGVQHRRDLARLQLSIWAAAATGARGHAMSGPGQNRSCSDRREHFRLAPRTRHLHGDESTP
jgi:hypothetical protein